MSHFSKKKIAPLFAWIFIIHEENNIIYPIYLLSFSFIFSHFYAAAFAVQPTHNHTRKHNACTNEWPVCEETYSPKSYRYHPGLWSGKKWSCCKTVNRTAFGCQAATLWAETNNNPSPSKLSTVSNIFTHHMLQLNSYNMCSFCAKWNSSRMNMMEASCEWRWCRPGINGQK